MLRLFHRLVRPVSAAVLAVVVTALAGCGGGTGVVTGKVTVEGQPLKDGLITFLPEGGNRDPFSARIRDGEYRTDPMPLGPAKAYITPPMDQPQEKAAITGDLRPPPKMTVQTKGLVPEKYTDVLTADLSLTVNKGENTFDVPMVP